MFTAFLMCGVPPQLMELIAGKGEMWSAETLCAYMSWWLLHRTETASLLTANASVTRKCRGVRETPFQSNIKCDARTSKKLYAECRVVNAARICSKGFLSA